MPSYFGPLTGKHYDSIEAMRYYEGRESMRRSAPSAKEQAVMEMPFEQFQDGIRQLERTEQVRMAQAQRDIDISAFLQAHEDHQDCDHNTAAMRICLGTTSNVDNATFGYYELEDAFNRLKAGGFLKLKANALQKQAEQAVTDRVEEIKREQHFDESEAYSIPMDQLRQRAGGVSNDSVCTGKRRKVHRKDGCGWKFSSGG